MLAIDPTVRAETYKGWSIWLDYPPIPSRQFDWCATLPDFDAEYDEGQLIVVSGEQLHAATYEDLLQAIEDAISEDEDA